jgi:hypothetical protein
MVATEGLLLAHVPPEGEPARAVDEPMHTLLLPVIVAPDDTVIIFVTKDEPTV